MASWYSNILTTTTSRISNLRSTLLGGDADGDTEDDTNVCRVLRAYYTEKGRAFPPWLPPDPKAPPPPVATPLAGPGGVGSRYGGGSLSGPASQAIGLSSLWDNSGPGSNNSSTTNVASLRQNTRLGSGSGVSGAAAVGSRASPFANGRNNDSAPQDYPSGAGGARPLPSQRLGSYQASQSAAAGSAQDKLRNLFSGGGSTTSLSSSGDGGRSNSPAQYGGSYSRNGGGGGGGGSGGGGGASDRPFIAANAPWSSDEYSYSGGGGGGGGSSGRSAGGLPSGPRRPGGGGLPSGPRMR